MKKILVVRRLERQENSVEVIVLQDGFTHEEVGDRDYNAKVIKKINHRLPTSFILQFVAHAIQSLLDMGYSMEDILSGDPEPKPNHYRYHEDYPKWLERNSAKDKS